MAAAVSPGRAIHSSLPWLPSLAANHNASPATASPLPP